MEGYAHPTDTPKDALRANGPREWLTENLTPPHRVPKMFSHIQGVKVCVCVCVPNWSANFRLLTLSARARARGRGCVCVGGACRAQEVESGEALLPKP